MAYALYRGSGLADPDHGGFRPGPWLEGTYRPWLVSVPPAREWALKRARWLGESERIGRRLSDFTTPRKRAYWTRDGTRLLLPSDSREEWAEGTIGVGESARPIPDYVVNEMFPDRPRGRPPLLPGLTPERLDTVLSQLVVPWIEHLEALESPRQHLDAVFPKDKWPPRLDRLLATVTERWRTGRPNELTQKRKAYVRRALARRLLVDIPIREGVDCSVTYHQLQGIDRKDRR